MAEVLGPQRVGKERRNVWKGSRALHGCDMFLDEYPLLEVGGPHCLIILKGMFVHATELGWKEAERLICWGHQHGLLRLDPETDVPAVQPVGYQTSQEEIRGLFHEVYMLKRLPGLPPCRPKHMEKATRDILSSLRSHLQRRGGTTKLEEGQKGAPAAKLNSILRPKGGITHMIRPSRKPGRCTMGVGCCPHSGIEYWKAKQRSQQCTHSCSCPQDRFQERCVWSLNPHRPRRHVTFCEPVEGTSSNERPQREPWEHLTRGEVEEGDLGPLPSLRPELEHFLEMLMTRQGTKDRWDYPLEPSIKNIELWLKWQACQLDTPHWRDSWLPYWKWEI